MNAYIQSVQLFCKSASLFALIGLIGLWNQSVSAQQGKGKTGGRQHASAGSQRSSGKARTNQNNDRRRSTQKPNASSSFAQRGVVQGNSSVGNAKARNGLQVDPRNRDTIYPFRSTGGEGSPSGAFQFDKMKRGGTTPPNATSVVGTGDPVMIPGYQGGTTPPSATSKSQDKMTNFEVQDLMFRVVNDMFPTIKNSSAANSNPNARMGREPKSGASRGIASPRDPASGQAIGKDKPSPSSLTGQDQETGEVFSFPGLGIRPVDGSTTQSIVNSEGWDEVPEHLLFAAKSRPDGKNRLGFRFGTPQVASPRDPNSGIAKGKNK